MKASFGADIKGLKKPSSVWMDDATYKDASGKATFTAKKLIKLLPYYHKLVKPFKNQCKWVAYISYCAEWYDRCDCWCISQDLQ